MYKNDHFSTYTFRELSIFIHPPDDALQPAELALVGAAAAPEDDGAAIEGVRPAQEHDGFVHGMRGQPVLPKNEAGSTQ